MNSQYMFVYLRMELFFTFLSNPQIVDLVIIVFCTVSTQIQKPFELSRCHSFLTRDLCKLNESSETYITGHEGSLLRILIITSRPVHNLTLVCFVFFLLQHSCFKQNRYCLLCLVSRFIRK